MPQTAPRFPSIARVVLLTVVVTGLSGAGAAIADQPLTVEGVWRVTKSNYPHKDRGYTIVRQGDGYNVIPENTDRGGNAYHGVGLYTGSPTQITATSTPSFDALMSMFGASSIPASVIGELAGKVTLRFRFTLSRDGQSLEQASDFIQVMHNTQTGRLVSYKIMPFADRATLVRVPDAKMPTNAAGTVRAVVLARGDFYILTKDGQKLTGKDAEQLPLEAGARVITGDDARVQLVLPDETVFTISANSDMEIDSFVYETPKTFRALAVGFTKGVFRWVTGKVRPVKDQSDMKVRLPIATIGIRGTDVEMTVNPDGTGSVVLQFGQVLITESKSGFTFVLDAGYKVTFDATGSFSRPIKITGPNPVTGLR